MTAHSHTQITVKCNYTFLIRTGLRYPDNDPLGLMCCQYVALITMVCVQSNNEHEVSLIWVWFSLLPHVVRRRLAEVHPTDGELVDLIGRQFHSVANTNLSY